MPDLASSQADAEPHSRLPETSLHRVPRPSKVSRDAASAKSSGNLWESYGEGAGGKHDTSLLPETPKPGPRPQGEGSPVQIFLVNIFGCGIKLEASGGDCFSAFPVAALKTTQVG